MPRERRQLGWVEKTGKKAKTWTGYWYIYVSAEGSPEKRLRRKKVLGKCTELTKGAAEDRLRDLIREDKPPACDSTFEQMSKWYLKTNEGRWSKRWCQTVDGLFRLHINPKIGARPAGKIKRSEIQQVINTIAASPECRSGSIVAKCVTHIRGVFNLAIDDELLERNPALKLDMPPTRPASERFLTLEECQLLLQVAQITSQRDYVILRIFMVCGLRPSELFALRLNDVTAGALRIDQTVIAYEVKDQTKTEGSKASVPLPPDLEDELRDYIRDECVVDFLFPTSVGTALSPDNYLDRVLKKLGVLAKIDLKKRVAKNRSGEVTETVTSGLNHQVLRRTTGTHFQKHGKIKDTQALLRHSNPTTTLKHYQKTMEESLVQGVADWDSELRRKGPGREEKVVSIDKSKERIN
jgi:integrase